MSSWRFDAIGVPWDISSAKPLAKSVCEDISSHIESFDREYSRFRPDSLVSQLGESPGRYVFSETILALTELYGRLYAATGGRVNPLVGHALDHWGYDSSYRLTPAPGDPPAIPAFTDIITLDHTTIDAPRPIGLDIGAVGKGFLVDLVAERLLAAGITEAIVDASGDLRNIGIQPEKVGLEDPADPTRVLGAVWLAGNSLAASSTNRRAWAPGIHHILDALTGLPTTTIRASWVVADTCGLADGLATALFVATPQVLEEYFSFQWAIVDSTGRFWHSKDFPVEVYS